MPLNPPRESGRIALVPLLVFLIAACGYPPAAPPLSGQLIEDFAWEPGLQSSHWSDYTGRRENVTLKVTLFANVTVDGARSLVSSKLFVLNSLYRGIRSPYPGMFSNRLGCADEFKPRAVENAPFDYYLLSATERFTYGACAWDLIAYRSVLYFLHCEDSESLYQMELFVPVNESTVPYESLLKDARCKPMSQLLQVT